MAVGRAPSFFGYRSKRELLDLFVTNYPEIVLRRPSRESFSSLGNGFRPRGNCKRQNFCRPDNRTCRFPERNGDFESMSEFFCSIGPVVALDEVGPYRCAITFGLSMFRGLYSGATALNSSAQRHEVTSNNLAHVNSVGYRRAVFTMGEQSKPDSGAEAPKAESGAVDFVSEGRYEPTGRTLDLAIHGEGFFQYQSGDQTIYSRNGVVFRNPDGQLINRDGWPLIGADGPIEIPEDVPEGEIAISENGTVSVTGKVIGTIELIRFDDESKLESENLIDFRAGTAEASPVEDVRIKQGSRELSNVRPVIELINLIVSSRHYEAAQRTIRAIGDAVQSSLQD